MMINVCNDNDDMWLIYMCIWYMVTIWILIIYFIVLDIYNAKRCQNYWSTSDFWSQNSMIWPSFWFNCNWYWVFDMKWIQIHVNYVKGAVIIEIFIYNSYYSVKSKLFIGFFENVVYSLSVFDGFWPFFH